LIETVSITGSTNADLLARLRAGEVLAEGHWLRAETQTGGKGRSGRAWISPPGNLYASTIVNLVPDDPPPQTLALAMGLAVYRHVAAALMATDRARVAIKWPNDVLVKGAKVAGILLERCEAAIVVGIGINLRFAPEIAGRATTSIAALNPGYAKGPDDAMIGLAEEVAAALAAWRAEGVDALIARWSAAALAQGSPLAVNGTHGEVLRGTFAGLARDGALMLRLANGATQTIHAGEVSLIAEGNA
jgi:BirA family biotin operon repressor/biotin-[acetyl-CoA-carboxylase] ligase